VGYTGIVALKDRGSAGLDASLSAGTLFNYSSGALQLSSTAYATVPALSLGQATKMFVTGGTVQNGFSVQANVNLPSPLPSSPVTVFSLGNDATGATGAAIRVQYNTTTYVLTYGTSPPYKTFPWTATNGNALPSISAGSNAHLLVRCFPNMVKCVLGNF
jgi:hypothetical protein